MNELSLVVDCKGRAHGQGAFAANFAHSERDIDARRCDTENPPVRQQTQKSAPLEAVCFRETCQQEMALVAHGFLNAHVPLLLGASDAQVIVVVVVGGIRWLLQ